MRTGQRLSDRLKEIFRFGPEDVTWYHFVRDHRQYLKRKSSIKRYTPEQLVKYRFRPHEFYMNECEGKIYMTWIFLLINDIREPSQFNENRTKLYVPSPELIEELHSVYSTSANRDRDGD